MIDRKEFLNVWAHLCTRFGRQNDADQAAAYFEFLSEQMDTEPFINAARGIWATSRFFPRPADFLLLEASSEWQIVLQAVGEYTPPHGEWHKHWKLLTPRSVDACRSLGGISSMRLMYERGDIPRLKAEWERAYEQCTTDAVLALPPAETKRLSR